MIIKSIGEVTFGLKTDFDLSFIYEYGEPFIVFDKQDSGNLCFGVQNGGKKLFLKFAGAATSESRISEKEAIDRIISTVKIYEDLSHPKLTALLEHRAVSGGYLLVFEWFEGKCMGKQYDSHRNFLQLPINEKLAIYQDILEFHKIVNEKGYIAIDFYDGCIMYNFDRRKVMLCDVEFYQKKPLINNMGRMWGSARYMSPEEFVLGAEIDERSNVFCMGATAFNLFGGEMDRSVEKWSVSEKLYEIALKAVSADRRKRHHSIGAYIDAWNGVYNSNTI